VELSLHETISNAVVHGNLGIVSATKSSAADFGAFAQALQAGMKTPEARRRIDIMAQWDSEFLDITVADKGKGYNESDLPTTDPFAPAGRGLAIIRSLTLAMNVTEGGRIITLRFLT
jgi:anti-sigma regulatory factor (Ser/Thr protein kinase)